MEPPRGTSSHQFLKMKSGAPKDFGAEFLISKLSTPDPTMRRGAREAMGRRTPRTAFTLVELLVVIAVIGLLAALVLPSLSQARSSAQRAQCVNSLKQLSAAAEMYWDDHNGSAFLYRDRAASNGVVYWFGWLETGPEETRAFDPSQGALYRYIPNQSVAICPALLYDQSAFKLKASGAAYGYGYNILLSAPEGAPPVQSATLAGRAGTVLFADAAQVNTFQAPASPANPMIEEFYYVSPDEATTHFRHRLRADTAFCDAHVEALPAVPGSFDPRMPAEFIGRLDPTLLTP
jgi:prepilin-type N-terminal cleavage/methylation domain-containing protein/prepilin-type processing-associated H-X9-DG protein